MMNFGKLSNLFRWDFIPLIIASIRDCLKRTYDLSGKLLNGYVPQNWVGLTSNFPDEFTQCKQTHGSVSSSRRWAQNSK